MGKSLVIKKVCRFLRSGSTKGKVDRLEDLTESLTENTALVAQKYNELQEVEEKVADTLKKLKEEDFAKEKKAIDNLDRLTEEERQKFKNALTEIKEQGIQELEPISESAQKIKAHMLITLNKAQIQKAVLKAKAKLAGNATIQLETLRIIGKETKTINSDLKSLLNELDDLNQNAIDSYTSFKVDMKNNIESNEDINIIDHIVNKMTNVETNQKKAKDAKKEAEKEVELEEVA